VQNCLQVQIENRGKHQTKIVEQERYVSDNIITVADPALVQRDELHQLLRGLLTLL